MTDAIQIKATIQQLDEKSLIIEAELEALQAELNALAIKGKAVSEQLENKREKVIFLRRAMSNLNVVLEYEQEAENPVAEPVDPWGDAG